MLSRHAAVNMTSDELDDPKAEEGEESSPNGSEFLPSANSEIP
ncbi:MAG TPA: hypothetical protein PLV70_14650 [Flavobacteriales bacterium]|nr:hypothetical protein [Flavobacteriales bacterium]